MDINKFPGRITDLFKKYKYAVLVLAIGLILMAIPGKKGSVQNEQIDTPIIQEHDADVCDELAEILQKIDGAGAVRVMLTVKTGEQTVYYEDEEITTAENSSDIHKTVVTVTDGDKNQVGLVRYTIPKSYLGALVVCQGADSASVKLSIIDAVSKITGLTTDRISVLKMKS